MEGLIRSNAWPSHLDFPALDGLSAWTPCEAAEDAAVGEVGETVIEDVDGVRFRVECTGCQ